MTMRDPGDCKGNMSWNDSPIAVSKLNLKITHVLREVNSIANFFAKMMQLVLHALTKILMSFLLCKRIF